VLTLAGFKELKERDHWDVKPSDKVKYSLGLCRDHAVS